MRGSPVYQWKNASLATTVASAITFRIDFPTSQKYLPFNRVQVQNKSAEDVEVYVDQSPDNVIMVPSLVTTLIEQPAISSVKVVNVGTGTIAVDELVVTAWLEQLTTDEIMRAKIGVFE